MVALRPKPCDDVENESDLELRPDEMTALGPEDCDIERSEVSSIQSPLEALARGH